MSFTSIIANNKINNNDTVNKNLKKPLDNNLNKLYKANN